MGARDGELQIHLFGGFAVRFDGQVLPPLPSRVARSLFALLALNAGRPQPRSRLVDRFWPQTEEARARRKLSHALWQVQDALGELASEHTYLRTPGDAVVFDADMPYWLDVEEFERRLDRVDASGALDTAAMRDLRRSVELYRGDLLAGGYELWALDEQQRLEQRYTSALTRLIEGCKQHGNFDEALTLARRLTHQSPLREDAHREVMRLSVLLGRPGEALEQYERCRSVLADELGTQPAAETRELHRRIVRTRDVTAPRRPPVEELVSRRLVGRDDERVTLVDQLERTLAGRPGLVFVEGEPGIGKTQLLSQMADDASWRGFQVLWGEARDDGRPYGAIARALGAVLEPVVVAQLRARVAPVWLQAASALLPALAMGADGGTRRSPRYAAAERAEHMREALTTVLVALAAIDPVLLVVEDAHVADRETLELLRRVGQRDHGGRLLTVLSFRDLEARTDEEVWRRLREVDRDARPVRLSIRALTPFETSTLVAEVLGTPQVPSGFVDAVHRESGGNPLYVVELLRALRDRGALAEDDRDRLDDLQVPVTEGLRSVISHRIEHLGAAVRRLLELGAVFGEEFPEDAVRHATAADDDAAITAALGEAVRRNVLETDGVTSRFTHAAMRRVLLDGLALDRLRTLHEAAGEALEATHPDRVEALAMHFRRAGRPQRALPYVRRAAERSLSVHAYATAAQHLRIALELLDAGPFALSDRIAVLLTFEEVLAVLGHRDEQADVLTRLEEIVDPAAPERLEVALRRAVYLGHVDEFPSATRVAEEAVQLATGRGDAERGRALTALGRVSSWAGDNQRAASILDEAAELLRGDPAAEADARFALGTALRFLQRFDAAAAALERSLALAEEHDDTRGVVQALGALADLHTEASRTDDAVAAYERAIELARSIGYRHREGVSLVNLATVRLLRGEPAAAAAAFDDAHRVFADLGNRRGVATVQLNRSWLRHRWLGEDDAADDDARRAQEHFAQVGNEGSAAVCLETRAAIARRRGDLADAERHLDAALDGASRAGERRAELQVRRGLAELALEQDEALVALEHLDEADALATRADLVEFTAEVASLRALALVRSGQVAAARTAADRALGHVEACGEPHHIHHRLSLVAAATGATERHVEQAVLAYRSLEAALQGLDDRQRERAVRQVREHQRIVEIGERVSPQEVTVRMATAGAPRGRPLQPDETVGVDLRLGPPAADRSARMEQLLEVLQQVQAAGAEATVEDLASIFDVSVSTVRRDLRELRDQGRQARTRGTGLG